MNYPLIIYLIGVLINCYLTIIVLEEAFNDDETITIKDFIRIILVCLLSWLFILLILIGWLGMHIESIVNKPLFKKHK